MVVKLGRVGLGLAIVLVLAGAVWWLWPVEAGLVREPCFQVRWAAAASGEGVGWIEGADGLRYGPQSFTVGSDGRLLIADTFRRRLLVVQPGGKETAWWALPEGFTCTDLAVDGAGRLYLVDGRSCRVLKLDRQGGRLWERTVLGQEATTADLAMVEAVVADAGGRLMVLGYLLDDARYRRSVSLLGDGDETVLVAREIGRSGQPLSVSGVLDAFVRGMAAGPQGRFYLYVQDAGEQHGRLLELAATGRVVREVSLSEAGLPPSARLAGVDGRGRVYFAAFVPGDQGILWVLEPNGRMKASHLLGSPGRVSAGVTVRVTRDGTIYTARSTHSGMEYESWRPVLVPRLLGRLRSSSPR